MRKLAVGVLLALLGGSALARPQMVVTVNHAARVPISGEASTVMVGDPSIADVMVIDRHTIFVRGKAYGRTEVIALDDDGRHVWQGEISVVSTEQGRVTVMRGLKAVDYTCAASRDCSAEQASPSGASGGASTTAAPAPRPTSGMAPVVHQ